MQFLQSYKTNFLLAFFFPSVFNLLKIKFTFIYEKNIYYVFYETGKARIAYIEKERERERSSEKN
jgi:hypothetical protein